MPSSTSIAASGIDRSLGLPDIFGHKAGLFLLFFTEMWERFSYYGMRALLVLFLVSELAGGGWGWSREEALKLYALYTGLVYFTPIVGGFIADKLTGHRVAVLLGALLMTLGHASMALESIATFYLGLALLILGNGFFKPNISTIVGQLYADRKDRERDAAYTIFYMGVNSGAFLGIMLCGYVGEKVSWSAGFGLAGIFMGLGMVMFFLGQSILGVHGTRATALKQNNKVDAEHDEIIDPQVIRDRLIVIGVLSFFTIFFWMAFEQAGGSMAIFAKDYTGRVMSGAYASMFFWTNALLTIVPLAIVTFVLLRLVRATFHVIPFSNLVILTSFVIVWCLAMWMLAKEFRTRAFEVSFAGGAGEVMHSTVQHDSALEPGQTLYVIDMEGKQGAGKLKVIDERSAADFENAYAANVVAEKHNETEIPASWFQILNSFFIVSFAPLFSRIWESRMNPSAPVKFGLGLILLGLGFGVLALGSMSISQGDRTATVSIWWLVIAFWLHTMGELCVSPVGLSYVSKLAPLKLVGMMFGVWFLASAIANLLAGWTGSYIDLISERYGLATFFLIYTVIPIVAGLTLCCLNGWMKRRMHGIE